MNTVNALAIVGATSLKGETFVAKLSGADIDLDALYLLDDESTAGEHVEYKRKDKLVLSALDFDFNKVRYVVLLGDTALSEQIYPRIDAAGCLMIDASGYLSQDDNVSLATLQEVEDIARVIAIPEATTLQLWLSLQGLLLETTISNLHVTVLQCAAQGGAAALDELGQQTAKLLSFQAVEPSFFDKQLAFNLIPQVGQLTDSGDTMAENIISTQLSRLFAIPVTDLDVTLVWSSVFYGDLVTVSLLMEDSMDVGQMISQWQSNPLIVYASDRAHTPVTDASGKGMLNISRVRSSNTSKGMTQLSFCIMSDPIHLTTLACLLSLKGQMAG